MSDQERIVKFYYTVAKKCVATYQMPSALVDMLVAGEERGPRLDAAVNAALKARGHAGGYKKVTLERIVDLFLAKETQEYEDEEVKVQDVVDVTPEEEHCCPACGVHFTLRSAEHVYPDIPQLLSRLEPGGAVPLCECPDGHCGALVYPDDAV